MIYITLLGMAIFALAITHHLCLKAERREQLWSDMGLVAGIVIILTALYFQTEGLR